MIRAVLFDVDGTLVDSVDLHARAWQEAFARYGRQIPFQKIRAQIGKGGDQIIPFFFPPEELERFGEELDHFRSGLFKEQYLPKVKPFPGVKALFQRIRDDGKRVVLASSAKEDEVDHYIEMLGVRDLVDGSTTSDDVEKSKPNPDIFGAALAAAGVESASEAYAVGDSPFDAEAAGRISIRTIGFLSGGFTEDDLRRAGCRDIYKGPEDLLAHYGDSPLARDERPEH